MKVFAQGNVKAVEQQIVVIRKDGTIEDHGTVYWHRNPIKRLLKWLGRKLQGSK